MDSNRILWITTVIMLLGGLLILMTGKRRTQAEGLHTVLHGIVPIIAACSYLAMATGQGLVVLPTDAAVAAGQTTPTRIFYFARYIDWTFTTPLLLVSLGSTAMRHRPKRHGAIVGAVLGALVIVGGILFLLWYRRSRRQAESSSCTPLPTYPLSPSSLI